MAEGVNVGTASVAVVPSMQGFSKKVSEACRAAFGTASAGAEGSGAKAGLGFAKGAGSGMKGLAASLKNLWAVAGQQAGNIGSAFKSAWRSVSSTGAIGSVTAKLSQLKASAAAAANGMQLSVGAALSVMQTKASAAVAGIASKVAAPFKAVATRVGGAFSGVATAVSGKLQPVAGAVKGVFSGIASTAKAAVAPVASAVTGALSPLGNALKGVGESAASTFAGALGTITQKVGPVLSGVASAVTKGLGVVAAAAGAAFTATATAALSGFADYEQLVGGVNKIFGESSATVQQYASNAYKTAGVGANQYMEQVTSFSASLISSLGGDTEQAASLANTAMVSMADNVNTYGSNMEDVQNAFQGFAKQNYTMLDNLKLGYGGTKEEMQRLVKDSAALTSEQEQLGLAVDSSSLSFDNIVKAVAVMQQHMGIAGTTANEAMSTISGSIGMAKAAWSDFATGLGRDDADFGQLTQNLLDSIGAVATNVAPRVATIGANIIAAFPTALAGLGEILGPVVADALASAYNIAAQALAGMGLQLPGLDAATIMTSMSEAAAAIQTAFGQVVAAVQPVLEPLAGLVQSVAAALQAFMPSLQNLAAAVLPLIAPVLTTICTALSSLVAFLAPIGAQVVALATQVITIVTPTVTQLCTFLQVNIPVALGVLSAIWNEVFPVLSAVVVTVFSAISATISTVMSVVQSVISAVTAAISGDWDAVWTNISTAFSTIWEGIKTAASSGVNTVYNTVTGIKGKITGFFSSAGSWLVEAGSAIINGLLSGIKSAMGAVTDFVSGIAGTIVSLKGPLPYDRVLLVPAGEAIVGGLHRGIADSIGDVYRTVGGIAGNIRRELDAGIAADFSVSSSGGRYRSARAASGGTVVNQSFSTKVVRADADLYSATRILEAGALRSAGA